MKKARQHSIKKPEITKDPRDLMPFNDEYLDMFSFKRIPVNEEAIRRIINDFIQEAQHNNLLIKQSQYFNKRGITYDQVHTWCQNYPWFKQGFRFGMSFIGDRREERGLSRKYDPGLVERSAPRYDPEWKEDVEWRANLKAEIDGLKTSLTVLMQQIPNSPMVPDKEKK